MKTTRILLIALMLGIAAFLSIAYAKRAMWTITEKPPVLLQEAIVIALNELQKEKDAKEYYCISASLARTFSEADWQLHFASQDGSQIWFSIASDKSIRKSTEAFEY